ncbi:nucleoside hydrolase [Pseudothermotoga thermarum]|uniref:Ribosylpyrimidine nucleosidase n=1 Tax=Pseudothermotoga thermarum DSM 5069 TaxID=688269 RepID=F7YTQ9_9THEM|nr:nucleoside hydrolase [Pseudothermotoga thermarum]AEH51287.1 Ribosylpyrimidine nucleosidase [Pseudothermotoga thermarum DSM 5069]
MRIILDCDPGHDDAFAILLAASSKEIELLGVTTVAGNSTLFNTSRNARIVLDMFDIDVPVYPGCAKPILRELVTAPEIHGSTGLDGAQLPQPKRSIESLHAVDFIAQMLEKYDDVVLVPTGPLTNVALFMLKYPHLVKKISSIVLMGGGIAFGNITPVAEFNIFVDPEAAKIVFNSGVPIVMAPLDLTHQIIATDREVERLRKMGDKFNILADLLTFFKSTYRNIFGIEGVPLHDPATIMYLVRPDIFEFDDYYVDVETKGELTCGQTVVDIWKRSGKRPNARVLTKVNRGKFFEIFFEKISQLRG